MTFARCYAAIDAASTLTHLKQLETVSYTCRVHSCSISSIDTALECHDCAQALAPRPMPASHLGHDMLVRPTALGAVSVLVRPNFSAAERPKGAIQ